MGQYMNPCVELCYTRYGRSYSKKCDTTCDYARIAREKDELELKCLRLEEEIRKLKLHEDDGK